MSSIIDKLRYDYSRVSPQYYGTMLCYVRRRTIPSLSSNSYLKFIQTFKYLAEVSGTEDETNLYTIYSLSEDDR